MQLSQSILVVSFYRAFPGKESSIYSKFQSSHPEYDVFKTLGSFDLSSFIETTDYTDQTLSIPLDGVSSKHTIVAYKWEDDTYKSPQINGWLKKAVVVGFIFLELDKVNVTPNGHSNTAIHKQFLEFFYENSEWNEKQVAFYGGVGKTDLFVIIKAEAFEELFKLAAYLRSLTLKDLFEAEKENRLFFLTNTIPLVSSNNVIADNNFGKIKGEVFSQILISCPPGITAQIPDKFKKLGAICNSYLGNFDLLVSFKSKIKSADLVEGIINYREDHDHKPALIDTETYIYSNSVSEKKIKPYSVEEPEEYPDLPSAFLKEQKALAVRIQAFIYQIFANLNLGSVYHDVFDMSEFPMIMIGDIIQYTGQKDLAIKTNHLNDLEKMLECAEIGLTQRTSSAFTPSLSLQNSHINLSNGVLNSISSINHIVRFIFKEMYEKDHTNSEWNGFVIFNDIFNFQLLPGDVFSLPHHAALSPIGKKSSWLILTHEISHCEWVNLSIDEVEDSKIIEIVKGLVEGNSNNAKEFGDETKTREIITTKYSSELRIIRGQLWELFAHWYDYYHFFNEEHDYYQKFIWESWEGITFVSDNMEEYLLRSFLIYIINNENLLDEAIQKTEEIEFIKRSWIDYCVFFKANINVSVIDISLYESDVLELYYQIGKPFISFKNTYKNPNFKKAMNEPYDELNNHISMIESGQVIASAIANPILLLKESRKRIIEKGNVDYFYNNAAFILSIMNHIQFLFSDKKDDE